MNEKQARTFAADNGVKVGKKVVQGGTAGLRRMTAPRSITVGAHVVFHDGDGTGGTGCWKVRKPDGTTARYEHPSCAGMETQDLVGCAIRRAVILEVATRETVTQV